MSIALWVFAAAMASPPPLEVEVGWPIGAVADIRLDRSITRQAGANTADWSSVEEWSIVVSQTRGGATIIVPSEHVVSEDEWTGTVGREPGMVLNGLRGDDQGVWRIGDAGDLEAVIAVQAQARLAPLVELAAAKSPGRALFLQRAIATDAMLASAKERWGAWVGMWAGSEPWTAGEVRQTQVPMDLPGMTGDWKTTASRSFEGWVPCVEGGSPECAELRMESLFDQRAVEAYYESVVAGTAAASIAVNEEIIGVVMHPDGAWPVSAILRKRTTNLHPDKGPEGPKMGRATQQQSREFILDWTLPAGPQPQ